MSQKWTCFMWKQGFIFTLYRVTYLLKNWRNLRHDEGWSQTDKIAEKNLESIPSWLLRRNVKRTLQNDNESDPTLASTISSLIRSSDDHYI